MNTHPISPAGELYKCARDLARKHQTAGGRPGGFSPYIDWVLGDIREK